MTLPNFYLIGAPKAGTTTLYSWLAQHPDIFLPNLKEPHYLQYTGQRRVDSELVHIRTLDAYKGQFAQGRGRAAIGEGSTMTFCFPEAAKRIRQLTPQARFIMILRQPAERAWSHYQFRVALGRERARSFKEALGLEKTRRNAGEPIGSYYLHVGRYAYHLRPWLELFPRERFHFVLFEELKNKPLEVVRETFRFLGLNADRQIDVRGRRNVTEVPASRAFAGAMRSRGALRSTAARVLPSAVKSVLYDLQKKNRTAPPEIPVALSQRIMALYERDIRILEERAGLSTEAWYR